MSERNFPKLVRAAAKFIRSRTKHLDQRHFSADTMSRKQALGEQKFTRRLEISAVLVENSARLAQIRGKRMEISAFCQAAAELGETKFCKACAKSRKAALHFPEKQHPFPLGISASAQGYCNFFEKFFDFLVTNGILMC